MGNRSLVYLLISISVLVGAAVVLVPYFKGGESARKEIASNREGTEGVVKEGMSKDGTEDALKKQHRLKKEASIRAQSFHTSKEDPWKKFSEKFGGQLVPRFGKDGRLGSVQGAIGQGKSAGSLFRPEDPQKAIARAKEILDSAHELMGVEDELPLGEPIARGSETSAQVYFQETRDGVPIVPYGSVTVDLGPEGELIRMDSEYIPRIKVENALKLTPDQARIAALSSLGPDGPQIKIDGGNPIVWISQVGNEGNRTTGRSAYEFWAEGRQIIVDGSSAQILFRRDRRQY